MERFITTGLEDNKTQTYSKQGVQKDKVETFFDFRLAA